jgi:choline dehydrogenase
MLICPLSSSFPQNTLDYLADPAKAQPDLEQWLKDGTGPLTSNVGEVAAFIRSVDPPVPVSGPKPKDYGSGGVGPDIEIIGTPMAYINHGETGAPEGSEIFTLVPIGLRPQSSGTITLKSSDVFDPRECFASSAE